MQSKAKTVKEYLAGLPADRRKAIEAVRKVVRANLDKDFEEGMQYGMIGYYVPHRIFPDGYHCDPKQPLPFAALASQKNHMAIYLACVYGDAETEARFREQWTKTGKKLDMGKSCVRFKKIEDVALDVIGRTIKRVTAKKYISGYQATLAQTRAGRGKAKAAASKKTSVRKKTSASSGAGPRKKTVAGKKTTARKTSSKPAKKAPARAKTTARRAPAARRKTRTR